MTDTERPTIEVRHEAGTWLQIGCDSSVEYCHIEIRKSTGGLGWKWERATPEELKLILDAVNSRARTGAEGVEPNEAMINTMRGIILKNTWSNEALVSHCRELLAVAQSAPTPPAGEVRARDAGCPVAPSIRIGGENSRRLRGRGRQGHGRADRQVIRAVRAMQLGYADPPYIGCAHLYKDHADFAGEVDHVALIERLQIDFDGWVLHTHATPEAMALLGPLVRNTGARWCSWNKPFAAFKRNVSVAYAWEPVIIKAARKPVVSKRLVMRDWISEPITMKRGLTGAKPEAVCHWAFELMAARPDDELCDLFPGSGAIARAWKTWCGKFFLPELEAAS